MGVLVLVPLVQRGVIDSVESVHHGPIEIFLVILAGLALLRFATTLLRRYQGGRVSFDVQLDLRNDIFDHLHELDFAVHDGLQTGQLVSRANSDLSLVQQLLAWTPMVIGSVIQALISLAVMAVLSPPLFAVALVIPIGTFIVAWRMRSRVFPSSWDAQRCEADLTTVVEESVSGVRVVKAFGREQEQLDRFVGSLRRLFGSRLRNVRLRSWLTAHLQSIPAVGQVLILALGGWLAIRGQVSLGTFVAFASYVTQLAGPARMSAGVLAVSQQARAGVDRIAELLDLSPTMTERPGARPLPPLEGRIVLENITFGYPMAGPDPGVADMDRASGGAGAKYQAHDTVRRGEPVLSALSLSVEPGEAIALMGPSGSGKSTLCMLLPRFYDVEAGSILMDGHDVRDVTLASLRRQVGIVLEESFLFAASVRDNIAFGRPDVSDEEIVRAARASEAHDFIAALPDGYDTVVGEGGVTLSGGQRQRIALARTLLVDPRVLVLDDATSAVDATTEATIYEHLRDLRAGRTMIVVAHRRSTLQLADKVVLLEHGSVADEGSFDELMVRSERFRSLLGEVEHLEEARRGAPPPLAAGGAAAGSSRAAAARGPAAPSVTAQGPPGPFGGRSWPGAGARGGWQRGSWPGGAGGWAAATGAGSGAGAGAGSGAGAGWLGQPPTEELATAIARLPAIKDEPKVDERSAARSSGPLVLRRFLRPWTLPLLVGLMLVGLDALCGLAGPYLIRYGLDLGVLRHAAAVLFVFSGAFALVTILDWWVMWAESVWTARVGERMLFALRVRVFAHLQRLGLDFYERELTGRIITRVTNDVETLSQLFQNGLVNALVAIGTFVGIAIVMLVMDVKLALVAMTAVPFLVVATIWFRHRSAVAYDRQRDRVSALNAHLQESISGIRVTQSFGREAGLYEVYQDLGIGYREASLTALRVQAIYVAFSDLLSILALGAVLGVGASLVESKVIPIGVLVAFLLYITQFFSPIQQLAQTFDSYQRARAGMRKLAALLDEQVTLLPPEHPVTPEAPAGSISFEHVSFSYPGTESRVLDVIDLSVPPGAHVALVGATGAGKSTIVKLLARFYDPTEGRLSLDGTDLRDLDLSWWRHHLGYVPQEPFLFAASIYENISFGKPDATMAEVEAVAREVGVHDAISLLPGGYDHVVSERGRSLSAGERQLICLARALLPDPLVLILDEATANLDMVAEHALERAMDRLSMGRTTFVIAHRLDTARRAGRIVVIAGGRMVESGTHEELMALQGRYSSMWQAAQGPEGSLGYPERAAG